MAAAAQSAVPTMPSLSRKRTSIQILRAHVIGNSSSDPAREAPRGPSVFGKTGRAKETIAENAFFPERNFNKRKLPVLREDWAGKRYKGMVPLIVYFWTYLSGPLASRSEVLDVINVLLGCELFQLRFSDANASSITRHNHLDLF